MEQIVGFLKTLGPAGLIMILLGLAYKMIPESWLADRGKTLIAAFAGIAGAAIFFFYEGVTITFPHVVDYVIYGVKEGLTAIGFFKTLQALGIVFSPPGEVKLK